MKLSADRATRAMMSAGAVFYVYWSLIEPNAAGQTLAAGTLFGGASFTYAPRPRPVPFVVGFSAVLLIVHALRGNPLLFSEGYAAGAGLPLLVHRFFTSHESG